MTAAEIRRLLLAWYDANARTLPWRVSPGDRRRGVCPDPYRVWLSEVMLQQTTVAHSVAYFLDFTRRWPTVEALAAAPDAEVMGAWAGLGYYARARNLLACARVVSARCDGTFPDEEEGLLSLPGVGPYTAAAVAAICYDQPTSVVDGNVERVIARLFAVEAPLPDAKPELKRLAASLTADDRAGDWAQALMDLGATVCRPRAPLCARCPLSETCAARASGQPETWPRRRSRAARPRRFGVAYVLESRGEIALVRRPAQGLLGGMLGLPTSDWRDDPWTNEDLDGAAPILADWRDAGEIEHVFTHFFLTLRVRRARTPVALDPDRHPALVWTPRSGLGALPSVFLKAAKAAL